MIEVITKGMMVSGGLIIAIGSQNAFVLKQGLLKQNIGYVIAICFLCDILLMALGVLGLGQLINESAILINGLAICGAAFLFWYGFNSFKSAYQGNSKMTFDNQAANPNKQQQSLMQLIAATFAITLLNPHVYLDTVVIVGGIGGTLTQQEKVWFLLGALITSFVWFVALGYGSRLLTPLFAKNRTWQWLDTGIGIMMWWIAIELLKFLI